MIQLEPQKLPGAAPRSSEKLIFENKQGQKLAGRLELTGALDDPQRQRLLEIANRCPVHRSLESEVHVATRLS